MDGVFLQDEDEADNIPPPSDMSQLGMFSVLPEEIVEKIILKSTALKEQVVLRAVCKDFQALCSESLLEYKWTKVLYNYIREEPATVWHAEMVAEQVHKEVNFHSENEVKDIKNEDLDEYCWQLASTLSENNNTSYRYNFLLTCALCTQQKKFFGPPSVIASILKKMVPLLKHDFIDLRYV